MLSSAKHHRNHNRLPLPPNNTSSSSSSPSSSSSQDSQTHTKTSLVTMEEVWKDINLASIHHINGHTHHPQHTHETRFRNQNPNSIFQDFLNRPMNQEPTIPTSLTIGSSSNVDTTTVTSLFSNPPLAPPATLLSLNSGAGFEFLDNQDPLVTTNPNHLTNVSSFTTPFEAMVTSTCSGKKRDQESNEGSGNRRHKRMIKNRESAARSRARKQAYTNELELEVAHLQAENARLERQQDQLRMAAANLQPKKNKLQRSFTAPF